MTKEELHSEVERRERGIDEVCSRLQSARAFLCDPETYVIIPSLDPVQMERLLLNRHLLFDGESIRDCIERLYGKVLADLIESLF